MKYTLASFAVLILTGAVWLQAMPHPSGFIANRGQWSSDVLFFARSQGVDVWLTSRGMVFDQHRSDASSNVVRGHAVRCTWEHASAIPRIVKGRPGASVSYMSASLGKRGVINASAYETVRLCGVYPNVDVVFSMVDGNVRYDLDVRPGADLSKISMKVEGGEGMKVGATSITVPTSLDANGITIGRLAAFLNGSATTIPCTFSSTSSSSIAFNVAPPAGRRFTIDPTVYASYYGGSGDDRITGMKVKSNGDVVVTGYTTSTDFPAVAGGYQATGKGGTEAFVAILDRKLHGVKSFTYLSGGNDDRARSLALDASGNIVVVGETLSSDFPVTSGSAGQVYSASIDGFVVKLSPDAKKLLFGMFIPGNKEDIPYAVALDGDANVFVVGGTTSTTGFPTTNGYKKSNGGQQDGFVMKIASSGASYAFSSFYGNEGIDYFTAVTVDQSGAPYITGFTSSSNFETAPKGGMWNPGNKPYDNSYNGGASDAFCMKFGEDGSGPRYCTYWGGIGDEIGKGVYVDDLGRCWIVGETTSSDLPAPTGFQQARAGGKDVFMAGFSPDGKELMGATYFGGTGDDQVNWLQKDKSNNAILGGSTSSTDFPVKGVGTSAKREGPSDGWVASITYTSNNFADVISGSKTDAIVAVDVDVNGDFYYAGITNSDKIPSADTAAQQTFAGGANDGWIGKHAVGTLELNSPNGGESWCIGINNTISWGTTDFPATEKFLVELSSDDGVTWSILANNISTRSYVWKPAASTPAGTHYRVRVTAERGHDATSATTFTVSPPPTITKQPDAASACEGGSVTLGVEAQGAGLKYQWRFNGANINGATTPSYSITSMSAATAGKYDVVVTGLCNPSATSKQITVGIAPATVITSQPSSVTVERTKPFTISVDATGDSLTYQWQLNGTDIPGPSGTQRAYTVNKAQDLDAGTYACVVKGVCGTVTSGTATVTVTPSTSVSDDEVRADIRILGPQPASDHLAVQFARSDGSPRFIQILDLTGIPVFSAILDGSTLVENFLVSSIPSGTYILTYRGSTRSFQQGIVIVH